MNLYNVLLAKKLASNNYYENLFSKYLSNRKIDLTGFELKIGNTTQDGTPTPENPIPIISLSGNQTVRVTTSNNTKDFILPLDTDYDNINNQDYIYNNNGKWYKNSNVGKVLFDGDETFAYREAGVTGIKAITITLSDMKTGNYLKGFCNYFKNNTSGKNANTIRFGANDKQIWIYVSESVFASANAFKTWLLTHNTSVYYILETATDTEITSNQLINSLNSLAKYCKKLEEQSISYTIEIL